jgi:hypothetical protein
MISKRCTICLDRLPIEDFRKKHNQCKKCLIKRDYEISTGTGGYRETAMFKHGSKDDEASMVNRQVLANTYRIYRKRLRILAFCAVDINDSENHKEVEEILTKNNVGSTFYWDGLNEFIRKAAENG